MKFKENITSSNYDKWKQFLLGKPMEFKNVELIIEVDPSLGEVDIVLIADGMKLDSKHIPIKSIEYDLSGYSRWKGKCYKDKVEYCDLIFHWKGRAWILYDKGEIYIADTKKKLEKLKWHGIRW